MTKNPPSSSRYLQSPPGPWAPPPLPPGHEGLRGGHYLWGNGDESEPLPGTGVRVGAAAEAPEREGVRHPGGGLPTRPHGSAGTATGERDLVDLRGPQLGLPD